MTNGSVPPTLQRYRRERVLRQVATGILCALGGLLVGLLLSGCAHLGTVAPRVGQEQAVHVVWVETFGRRDRPPLVRWLEGDQLPCTDKDSGKPGFWIPKTDVATGPVECREGFTWGPLEVLVAWHGELTLAETALAHELLHAALLRSHIILERHHDLPDFFSTVDRANQAIIQAGR